MIHIEIAGMWGELFEGGHGFKPLPRTVIGTYEPGDVWPDGSKKTLLSIVRAFCLRHGGDFIGPQVYGLRLYHKKEQVTLFQYGHRHAETVTSFLPVITPELSVWVAWDDAQAYPLPFPKNKVHAVVEYAAFDPETLYAPLLESLQRNLDEFWERNLTRVAPPTMLPESGELAVWGEWAGEGYFHVESARRGWQRRGGYRQERLKNSLLFLRFVLRHDDVSRFKATFYGDRIEVTFSGHDTYYGLLTFYPCPDNDWSV